MAVTWLGTFTGLKVAQLVVPIHPQSAKVASVSDESPEGQGGAGRTSCGQLAEVELEVAAEELAEVFRWLFHSDFCSSFCYQALCRQAILNAWSVHVLSPFYDVGRG